MLRFARQVETQRCERDPALLHRPSVRALLGRVEVEGWTEIHIDDQVRRGLDGEIIRASIDPAAVTVLG